MEDDNNPYKSAYERERKARLKAEQLLEDKARELYSKNVRLEESYSQLKKQQTIMLNNEKLATLGTLSAGIAHEINNPLAFVKSNVESLLQYQSSYSSLIALIKELTPHLPEEDQTRLTKLFAKEDLDYIEEDLPELMTDTMDGLSRVRDIIQNLRSFSRTQSSDRELSDLNAGIKTTLKLLNSELKNSVTLNLELSPLPEIECNLNELNQVILNLLINAKHATHDVTHPTITLKSESDSQYIRIIISDNGCGMNQETLNDIFVPFFTTKPVGKGTGMGLAIAHSIIQDHKGDIHVDSAPGQGTTFTIKLPLN